MEQKVASRRPIYLQDCSGLQGDIYNVVNTKEDENTMYTRSLTIENW